MAFDKRKALQNALAYTQQGKWDRAIAEYQSILKSDPRDVTVCNNLGDLYARAGKTADAIDQYLKLGDLYRADGLSVKAIAVYKKIAKLDPTRTEAYLACADLYWEQGLVGEAKIQMATVVEHYSRAGDTQKLVDAYRRLTQFDPTNPMVIARLADLMVREGKREAAAAEYERAAQAAQAAGQAAEAKRLLQKARELLPGVPEANVGLAERLIGEGKTAEAIGTLTTLTHAEPGNGRIWRLLGEIQASQQQADEAIPALQRAVALGVPETEIARPLGRALLQTGQTEDAIALCRRVSDAGLAAGEPDMAVAYCRELLAEAPQLADLHAYLVGTLQNLGRMDEARAAMRALAAAEAAAGNTEAAAATYRQLLTLDTSDAEARAALETLRPPAPAPPELAEALPPPQGDSPQPGEESAGQLQAATAEPLLSPLEDLGLSLEPEDAALLLEESDCTGSDSLPSVEPTALEADVGGGEDTGEEAVQSVDWLTQELQSIDLDQAVSAQPPQPTEADWSPDGQLLEVEDIAANRSGVGLSGSEGDAEVDLGVVPGRSDEPSSLIDMSGSQLPERSTESERAPLEPPSSMSEVGALNPPEADADSGQVAEQLAEADVYQKYGLEEKARERLLEVVRLAPENLTAHRRLKGIYLDRRQTEEVCTEVLAIARTLRAQRREAAAAAEIREGLLLAPDHTGLQDFLMELTAGGVPDSAEVSGIPFSPVASTDEGATPTGPMTCVVGSPETAGASMDGAPPPDVPLLLELDEVTHAPDARREPEEGLVSADAETLPTELEALLDDNETEPILVVDQTDAGHDQAMADDVAEAQFYLSQGMTDEAQAVHRRMQGRDPAHPAVAALAAQLDRPLVVPSLDAAEPVVMAEPPSIEAVAAESTPATVDDGTSQGEDAAAQFTVSDAAAQKEPGEFVDLGAELEQELGEGDTVAAFPSGGPVVDGLLKELQRGVREHLDEKDYETHYNLGIAYKEMELYDEAIQEFRLTAREPKRALECADLVALCYLAKGQPAQAIQDLQAGLAIPGHPSEAYHHLRYDLGMAFEGIGDLPRALEQFELLQSEGARFLDVQTRAQALRAQVARKPGAAVKDEAGRRKRKISFI
jgi:pilus assembly protein FimV